MKQAPESETGKPDTLHTSAELITWLARLERRHPTEIDLGLERCGRVYQRLGAPRPAPRVITVAGTNGKGSTVAWSNAVLAALGCRTGVYTSPHLMHFTERLALLGETVTPRALVEAFDVVEAARADISLTYFEFTTLACLWLMARADLDVAILEVGLGGRLDTVNLVDADAAIITPVGLDHQAFLGNDRDTIGREKAGILRAGQLFISAERQPPNSVLQRARTLGCEIKRQGDDFDLSRNAQGALTFRLGDWRLPLPGLDLLPSHQQENLSGALAAVFSLYPERQGDAECAQNVALALSSLQLRGRLQCIDAGPGYLLDVGHNPLGAEAIARARQDADPCVVVLGMLADKDAEGVARALAPVMKTVFCAGLQQGKRSQTGDALAQRVAPHCSETTVIASKTVAEAMRQATDRAGNHGPVLVFGSFHTVAEAMTWLTQTGQIIDD